MQMTPQKTQALLVSLRPKEFLVFLMFSIFYTPIYKEQLGDFRSPTTHRAALLFYVFKRKYKCCASVFRLTSGTHFSSTRFEQQVSSWVITLDAESSSPQAPPRWRKWQGRSPFIDHPSGPLCVSSLGFPIKGRNSQEDVGVLAKKSLEIVKAK